MNLYNLNRQVSLKRTSRLTISFYRYCKLKKLENLKNDIQYLFSKLNIFGRIYISTEGINAQISIIKNKINDFQKYLSKVHKNFNNLYLNVAIDNEKQSFFKLKVKIRKNIVADGIYDKKFKFNFIGKRIHPKYINNLIDDNTFLFLDVRNYYEYEIGHFKNAIVMPFNTFRKQLIEIVKILKDKKNENIVLYCTGGIRCEKASSWMLYHGFKNIYQIYGGIIKYVNYIKKNKFKSKFIGNNFVFDNRLKERITDDIISHCHICQIPSDNQINCKNSMCHNLFIQCENCFVKYKGFCSLQCKENFQKN